MHHFDDCIAKKSLKILQLTLIRSNHVQLCNKVSDDSCS